MENETLIEPKDAIERFFRNLDDWTNAVGVVHTSKLDELKLNEIKSILDTCSIELSTWTGEECLEKSFQLHSYAEYVQSVLNREKAVSQWSDDSLWAIVGPNLSNYGDGYTKHQQKFHSAIKESPLAREILKVSITANARVLSLSGLPDSLRSMAELLKSLGHKREFTR